MTAFREILRAWRATPVVLLTLVLSLGLGIGATTAVFSLIDGLLLKNLPVPHADRLALIIAPTTEYPRGNFWATRAAWREMRSLGLFESSCAWTRDRVTLEGPDGFEPLELLLTSGEFFETLGIAPHRGRFFDKRDDRAGGGPEGPVLVLSYDFWRTRFGGSTDVLGRIIVLERAAFTIIGIAPDSFSGPDIGSRFDVAIPLETGSRLRSEESASGSRVRILARLAEGDTPEKATLRLRAAQPGIREASLPNYARARDRDDYMKVPLTLVSAANGASFLRSRYEKRLLVLLGVIGAVLALACGNVAGLMFARVTDRRRELAIRSALGASRLRLLGRLFGESLLLSGLGATLGLLLGCGASRVIAAQMSTVLESVHLDLSLDGRVAGFAAAAGILTAALFGAAPAWRGSRTTAVWLGSSRSPSQSPGRHVLLTIQVALSLLLVTVAGQFVRTFVNLAQLPLGFDPDPVLAVDVDLRRIGVEPERKARLYEEVLGRVRTLPGVASAGTSPAIPVGFRALSAVISDRDGSYGTEEDRTVHKNVITPDWLGTLGTAVRAGRDFDASDRGGSPRVAIVNEAFARRFFSGTAPVGQRVSEDRPDGGTQQLTIVGVVEDAIYRSVKAPVPPTIYLPLAQIETEDLAFPFFNLVVRGESTTPESLVKSVSDVVADVDPNLVLTATPLGKQVRATFNQERLQAMLVGGFGAVALFLAGLGIHGVTAQGVSRRRREIGVRLALGADRARLLGAVTRPIVGGLFLGFVLGVPFTLWASTLVRSLLFGVPEGEGTTLVLAFALLGVAAAVAAIPPLRRAARVDVVAVLRQD